MSFIVGEANLYIVIYSTFSVAYLSHWVQGWVLASEIASSTQYNTIFFLLRVGTKIAMIDITDI